MVTVSFTAAARIREVLALLDGDAPAPHEIHMVVQQLASGTVFEAWFLDGKPSAWELLVACGQLAAARPGAGLGEAFANLAEDCLSVENTTCPDRVVSVYQALAAAVPKFGPAPHLRAYIRTPTLFFPDTQEISALAAAAAGLIEMGTWDD